MMTKGMIPAVFSAGLLLVVLAVICGTGGVACGATLTVTDATEAIVDPSNDLTKN